MPGTPNGKATPDMRIMRRLLIRAGLDEQSAARELEIDQETMQGYTCGDAVPRRIVFALMQLADVAHTARRD